MSQTAQSTALLRALAHKEFQNEEWAPDYLAECFLNPFLRFLIKYNKSRTKVLEKSATVTPGVYEYMIARTRFFDDTFAQAMAESIPQIVFLGAGYDTRILRLTASNVHTQIFELDEAATQKRKIKCLKKKHRREPFEFRIEENNIVAFLGEYGHKVIRHLDKEHIENVHSVTKDGKPNGLFNIVITSPI